MTDERPGGGFGEAGDEIARELISLAIKHPARFELASDDCGDDMSLWITIERSSWYSSPWRWLFNGHDRSQRLQRKWPTANRYVGLGWAMCAWKDFERVAVEIETDRAIRRVIHDHAFEMGNAMSKDSMKKIG